MQKFIANMRKNLRGRRRKPPYPRNGDRIRCPYNTG